MTGNRQPLPSPARTGQAISAVRWSLVGSIVQRLITFACVAVVARVLGESEYGVYRQLLAVHLVIFVLLPLGFDQLYIREVRHRSHFLLLLSGALTFAATIIAVVALAGHSLIVRWMDFGPWSGMLWLFPVVVAVQARKLIYKTELAARLDYRQLSFSETLYALVAGLGGVLLVLAWHSAWGLYIAYGCAEIAEFLWLRRRAHLQLPSVWESLRVLRKEGLKWKKFGAFHCGAQVLNAVGGNAPVIILGSVLSKAAAAAFSIATFLIIVPIFLLVGALHNVAFSALAGRTREQLTRPVTQMLSMSAAFIVPVLLWVALLAKPIVGILLGESWIDSTVPIAHLLSIYCVFAVLFSPVSSLDILLDRPDYGFYWNVVATTLRIVAVVLGLRYGVIQAAAAFAVCSALMWVIWGVMLAHLLGAGQWIFHRSWLKMTPLWLFLGLLLYFLPGVTNNPWLIVSVSIVPAAIYAGLLYVIYPSLIQQGLRLAKRVG